MRGDRESKGKPIEILQGGEEGGKRAVSKGVGLKKKGQFDYGVLFPNWSKNQGERGIILKGFGEFFTRCLKRGVLELRFRGVLNRGSFWDTKGKISEEALKGNIFPKRDNFWRDIF